MESKDPIRQDEASLLPLRSRIGEWWHEATGPITQGRHLSMARAVTARLLMWAPVVLVTILVAGGLAAYGFIRWRAGDLAAKAVESARQGNLRMASLQLASAASLRGSDPRVLHARALVETQRGHPQSPSMWESLPAGFLLTSGDLMQKAHAMTRFGSDPQFEAAVAALEVAGMTAEADARRAERLLARRDYDTALRHARGAVSASDTPEHRLALAQLLAMRHRPLLADPLRATAIDFAAAEEIAGLVDSITPTPLRNDAIAFGLGVPGIDAFARRRWAHLAMENPSPDNKALLAAADVLIESGVESIDSLRSLFAPAFRETSPSRRAAFAAFLTAHGLPEEALSFVRPEEATREVLAFRARAAALAASGRWGELLALTDLPNDIPQDRLQLARARAARQLGREGLCRLSVSAAITHGLREGNLAGVLRSVDAAGEGALADELLLAACRDPETADDAFRAARDRFGRRGQFVLLDHARDHAAAAAPQAPSVVDDQHRRDLLTDRPVDPRVTASALEEDPSDTDRRITHALALMRAGRAEEAWAAFADITLFFHGLTPGQQAIIAALAAARGDAKLAAELAATIDLPRLENSEVALIAPLRR